MPGAQPPTLTLTDNTNLNYGGTPGTNTSGARAYASACVSAVDISGNVEQLLDFKVTGNSWPSQPGGRDPDEHDQQHHSAGQLEIPAVHRGNSRIQPDHHKR